mmetsp:Transcript_93901/g.265699  ORF Transcript_93901/g.265699 Transcript_93901/m.265699 type:complete len:258 (-) Transcript_93901:58-831(-)
MYADFDWAEAPLSSWTAPVSGGVAYLVVVALLGRLIPAKEAKGLDAVLVLHNGILSAWSLLMFLGCLAEMAARWGREGGLAWAFCEVPQQGRATGPLYFWSYIFYISKYYEMVDTVLALVRGSRPPHFRLHVYHHALVPVVVWNWLEYRQTLQFPGLLFNTFVHVIMYAYYVFKVLGWPTPWKRWVTRLQIVQFITSLLMLCVTLTYVKGDAFGGECSGLVSLWTNIGFNLTLLWQFVGVLLSSASRGRAAKGAKEG